jgi:hypothetical protein
MNEADFTEHMNDRLKMLFDLYPIEDLRPGEVSEEMKLGLAKFYSDRGQRSYIENAIKIAIRNMGVASTAIEISYYKSRVDVLEQLLAKGKQSFQTIQVTKEMKGAAKHATQKG